jgi:undecaprenyl diphosphate synthase
MTDSSSGGLSAKIPAGVPERVPLHIAVIMDGNGRWAQARGLPRVAGHRAGTDNLRQVIEGCVEFGVKYLTLFAFSTENWSRPKDEIKGLMGILEDVIDRELEELHKNGVRLKHLGKLEGLGPFLQKKILRAIDRTKSNDRLILNIAFNYGGRDEIVCAVREIVRAGIPADQVDESVIEKHLFTAGLPDPDLLIRTSGEMRTSNFLLWQMDYTELYFPDVNWPDFTKEELRKAIWVFSRRNRRFGKLPGASAPVTPC